VVKRTSPYFFLEQHGQKLTNLKQFSVQGILKKNHHQKVTTLSTSSVK